MCISKKYCMNENETRLLMFYDLKCTQLLPSM